MNVTSSVHYTFENIGATYRFIFPYRKEWLRIGSYALSVVILAVILLPAAGSLLFQDGFSSEGMLFSVVFGGFCLLFGGLVLMEALWQLMGREVVEVDDDAMVIRHQILGIGPSKRFPAEKVDGLSVSQDNRWASVWGGGGRDYRFFNFKRGRVALNSGKSLLGSPNTYRFGTILDEGEAEQVVTMILNRFPQYKAKIAVGQAPKGL
jgi:hypothetical protein